MTQYSTISAEELKQWIDEGKNFVLIDVLAAESYEVHHIPTAVSIPLKGSDFIERVEKRVPNKDNFVVVYCASEACQLSPQAADALVEAGYTNVYDFEGGLAGWKDAGYEFTTEAQKVE